MSYFTHACKCGCARENHAPTPDAPGAPCQTARVTHCGCAGASYGPSALRETFVPAWVDGHRMGEHDMTPVVTPGTRVNLGSGSLPTCACPSCATAYADALEAEARP